MEKRSQPDSLLIVIFVKLFVGTTQLNSIDLAEEHLVVLMHMTLKTINMLYWFEPCFTNDDLES